MNNQMYTGSTSNLRKRIQEHNSGKSISTKRYLPWKLFYYEAYVSEVLARMREKRLKYNGNALRELKKRIGFLKSGAGFTLVELLAATAVIMVVGGIITSILFSSLRGSSKTAVLTQVRQQGSFAISQIEKELRSAVSIVSFKVYHVFPVSDEVFYGTAYCNSLPDEDLRNFDEITFTTLDQETITLQCKQSPDSQIYSITDNKTPSDVNDDPPPARLLDNSAVTMISCHFTCLRDSPSAPPVIGISFYLTEKRDWGIPQVNEKSTGPTPIPFRSSVVLRN